MTSLILKTRADRVRSFLLICRQNVIRLGVLLVALVAVGCVPQLGEIDSNTFCWSRKGLDDGRFIKPRAIAINEQDQLFIVDKTSRIQVFDRDGNFIRSWRTPACENGKPCGLSISHDNLLMVADTHYFRVLFYTFDGQLIEDRTIGGETGHGPGQFGFLTDVVQDSQHNYYVGEYGNRDRIQKFDPQGNYVCQIGSHGQSPGQFLRPQGLHIDRHDRLWVADSFNHRIQVFDVSQQPPVLLWHWGEEGAERGKLRAPYSIEVDNQGDVVVCELGNHRLQKFTADGKSIAAYGGAGRGPGQFHQPWAAVADSTGAIHILDSYNHRVQRWNQPWASK